MVVFASFIGHIARYAPSSRVKNTSKIQAEIVPIYSLTVTKKGEPIPKDYKPHLLKGEWKDFMECHIDDDYLLIWFDKEENVIRLVRLGSHSELFGKRRKR